MSPMEIQVNGQPLEYTLDGETTVGEVKAALTRLFAPHGRVITALGVDGDSSEAALARPVTAVKMVQVEVAEVNTLVLDTLGNAGEYLGRVLKTIADVERLEPAQQPVEVELVRAQLVDGMGWVLKVVQNCAFLLKAAAPELTARVDNCAGVLIAVSAAPDREAAARLVLHELKPLVKGLHQVTAELILDSRGNRVQLRQARVELERFTGALPVLSGRFKEVAIALQSGREYQALQLFQEEILTLQEFIGFLQTVQGTPGLDFKALTVGDKSLADKVQDFLDQLKKIVATFANKDYVLLADLLEYELAPLLDSWREALPLLDRVLPRE